jgi:hypothetical protein
MLGDPTVFNRQLSFLNKLRGKLVETGQISQEISDSLSGRGRRCPICVRKRPYTNTPKY